MHIKKHIKLNLNRTFLHLKSIGFLVFVPLIVINVIIPALNFLEYYKYGVGSELYSNISKYTQWFIPFFSVWWIILVLREYVESDGNELLYVHSDRCKLKDILNLFMLFMFNVIILYSVYTFLFPNMKYEFIKLFSICIFYLGIAYSATFLAKTITIPIMLLILYTLANCMLESSKMVFPLYISVKAITFSIYIKFYLPFLLIGIVLLLFGTILNKRWLKFV